jgi:lipoprotein-anchoring transpeptidase ErfK/SrfK
VRLTLWLITALTLAALSPAASANTWESGVSAVTLGLSTTLASYGDEVVATGQIVPAEPGQEVLLQLETGSGPAEVGRSFSDDQGAFSLAFTPPVGGTVRAVLAATGASSLPVELAVVPRISVAVEPGTAYLGARMTARVRPATYAGEVSVTVMRGDRAVAESHARVADGRLRMMVPTPGIGRFTVHVVFPATGGFAGQIQTTRVTARARTLASGSSGPDVRALSERLSELRFRVPGLSTSFTWELADSVIAFQKAYGLPRTGTAGPQTLKRLERARPLKPRFRSPALHIEVDKTRQILMVVRGGSVRAVLPVSTGATGNTPEGKHAIRWKAPATTTWLGSGILYRTLTFSGDSFAIHGWPDVPAYPASHGCVRIPIWAADWLYQRSPVGETVYVY